MNVSVNPDMSGFSFYPYSVFMNQLKEIEFTIDRLIGRIPKLYQLL